MPLFEYTTIFIIQAKDVDPILNDYGKMGWELVDVEGNRYTFMRQAPAPKQPGPSETK